jgi:uncharacterized protein (TIGR02145 family)
MKKNLFLTVLLSMVFVTVFGQHETVELTFTAIDSTEWAQLNHIKVINRTQGSDTILYWPDTVLVLGTNVGTTDMNHGDKVFRILPSYPNPVLDQTTISFFIPSKDEVNIIISDVMGRVILKNTRNLERGYHSYRFEPGYNNLYILTAQWKRERGSVKILQPTSPAGKTCTLEYLGCQSSKLSLRLSREVQAFFYDVGDELLFIGFTNTLQSGIVDAPLNSKEYTFQFAINIPCPGIPSVTYEGQVYNTIQILSQCWLKENLNIGTMIDGHLDMADNDLIEKYCYNNAEDSCTKYGGLYQWNEMMQYTTINGTQGICPPGWHIPADEEWKVLEGAVDSYYEIGSPVWDIWGTRGFDAGTHLKDINGWWMGGYCTDLYGFSALPGGRRSYWINAFDYLGESGLWWTSTENDIWDAWPHVLDYYSTGSSYQNDVNRSHGFSVRCVKD